MPDEPAAAAPKGLLLPLKALNALLTSVVAGDDAGVVSLAGLNGDGDDGVPKLDFPKIVLPPADPKLDLPKTDVEEGVPKEDAPNVGPGEPSLLGGVVVAPNDVWPNTEVCGVVVAPGFWKNGDDEGVVVPPNAPKPGWSLLNPVADVVKLPNAPPAGGGAAGVVVGGVTFGCSSLGDLTGGVAGGVATAGDFSGDAGAEAAAGAGVAPVEPSPNALVVAAAEAGVAGVVDAGWPNEDCPNAGWPKLGWPNDDCPNAGCPNVLLPKALVWLAWPSPENAPPEGAAASAGFGVGGVLPNETLLSLVASS